MATTSTPATYYYANYRVDTDTRVGPPVELTNQRGEVVVWGGAANYKSGQSNPGWRDRIAKHVDASSAYTRKVFREITPSISFARSKTLPSGITSSYVVDSFVRNRSFGGSVQMLNNFDSTLQNQALSRLKNKLRQQTSSANVMAPIAESRELHRLVQQSAHFSLKTVTSVQQLRKGKVRGFEKHIEDSWLAWNFGINPMIKDIKDMGEAIASFIARQDLTYPLHGSASREGTYSYTPSLSQTVAPLGCEVLGVGSCVYKLSYRYAGAFHSTIKSSTDYSIFDHLGISFANIPSTLWELTAYSWMYDYYSNIGAYLQDAFYAPPGNLVYLTLTRRYDLTADVFISYRVIPGNPNNVMLTSVPKNARLVYKEIDRTVLATLPHVGLSFYSFDTVGKNAIPKLLNLVSVLRK